MKQNFLRFLAKEHVVFLDGALGTYLHEKGVVPGSCIEGLNLTRPELVLQTHREYLQAGSEVLMTNTWGANIFKLGRFGLEDRLDEINGAGVRIARQAAGENAFVAGSVGPLGVLLEPYGELGADEAEGYFRRHMEALVAAGVDLLLLETFANPAEAAAAVRAARQVTDLPLVLSFAVNDAGQTRLQVSVERCLELIPLDQVDVLGFNCMIGPYAMLSLVEKFRTLVDRPFLAMPNAGRPRQIDGRTTYVSTPDDFRRAASRLLDLGVSLLGGCCGTTPAHIRALSEGGRSGRARRKWISVVEARQTAPSETLTISPEASLGVAPRLASSALARAVRENEFVLMAELVPERGAGFSRALSRARALAEMGVNGINIPDGPRATARMSPLALSVLIQQQVGVEAILHYACRDRNILGIQADLLGAWALGVQNLLVITGDPPVVGDLPRATGVFDLDAIGLVNLVHELNQGRDVGGNVMDEPTAFFTGVGVNPFAEPLDRELARLRWKMRAGADYAITQPVFSLDRFHRFMEQAAALSVPVIAGIWPLVSLRNAEFITSEIPGIIVPNEILDRLGRFDSPADQLKAGIEITLDLVRGLKDSGSLRGLQFSIPLGRYQVLREILPAARV